MTPRLGLFVSRPLALAIAAALSLLLMVADAAPQQPQAPSLGMREQPPAAPPQDQPAPQPTPENPGLFKEMGKLIDRLKPSIKSPAETLDDLNARAKDAGEAISRLARPGSMVSGRMACPLAADRTPDCKAGADRLCQGKGYKEGKSLNTDSAETCSAKVLIPGRQRKPDDCHIDTYVTTALCQ
jgi:hypothetical protein